MGLLRTIAGLLGQLYFRIGMTALEAAWGDVQRWPAPVPGASLDLPLLGQVLRFHVPWTGREGASLARHEVRGEQVHRAPPPTGPSLTLAEVFASKHSELPGVFQEIGLFSTFRSLTPHLWTVWELVLTGRPLAILAPSPDACGDAVMAAISLIAPLAFTGDFRPYITLYDPDFKPLAATMNAPGEAAAAEAAASMSGWAASLMSRQSVSKRLNSPRLTMPLPRARPTALALPQPAAQPPARREALSPHQEAAKPGRWVPAASAGVLPALPPLGGGSLRGSAYSVPAEGAAQRAGGSRSRRRRLRLPPPSPEVGAPIILGSTNPFFAKALALCPNALWLGSRPPLLPTPSPTSLPAVAGHARSTAGGGAPSPASPPTAPDEPSEQRSLPRPDSFMSSGGGGGGDAAATDEADVHTATAAEVAAANAAALAEVEGGPVPMVHTAGTAATRSVTPPPAGKRRLMTPVSRTLRRAASGRAARGSSSVSAGTMDALDEAGAAWDLQVLSSEVMREQAAQSASYPTTPAGEGPAPAPSLAAAHAASSTATVDSAGGETSGDLASVVSSTSSTGVTGRVFPPHMLSAAAAAYHASYHAQAKCTVLSAHAHLTTVLPEPGGSSDDSPMLVTRRQPALPCNQDILRQLLPLRRGDEAQLQVRLVQGGAIPVTYGAQASVGELPAPSRSAGAGAGTSVQFHGMLQGEVPAVLINNALLRQHFRGLTQAFLRPFERFFSVGRAAAIAAEAHRVPIPPALVRGPSSQAEPGAPASPQRNPAPHRGGGAGQGSAYGPYDDLAGVLLPAFDRDAFMSQLAATGPPAELRGGDWLRLYTDFVRGPNFPSWFHARREEAKRHLRYLSRALRLSATPADIHGSIAPGLLGASAVGASSTKLYAALEPSEAAAAAARASSLWSSIRSALREEYGAETADPALHAAMVSHASAVWPWLRSTTRQVVKDAEWAMLQFGDTDSLWILRDLAQEDTSCVTGVLEVGGEAAAHPAPRQTHASAGPAHDTSEDLPHPASVDFEGTAAAIAATAGTEQDAAAGQARGKDAGGSTVSSPEAHSSAPASPSAAAPTREQAVPHSSEAAPGTPASPDTESAQSAHVEAVPLPRQGHAQAPTPLPTTPRASTAQPTTTASAARRLEGVMSVRESAPTAALGSRQVVHLAQGGAGSSTLMGAGGLIGHSTSHGKAPIVIQRR